jgi:hypothetical protein
VLQSATSGGIRRLQSVAIRRPRPAPCEALSPVFVLGWLAFRSPALHRRHRLEH